MFRRSRALRLCASDFLNLGSILALNRIVGRLRWSRYDAGLRAVLTGAPQLFRVALADVNGLIAALFPANDNRGSIVAVEPVMGR